MDLVTVSTRQFNELSEEYYGTSIEDFDRISCAKGVGKPQS
jgi:hypothetical protein